MSFSTSSHPQIPSDRIKSYFITSCGWRRTQLAKFDLTFETVRKGIAKRHSTEKSHKEEKRIQFRKCPSKKKSSLIFGILRVVFGGDLGRFFFFRDDVIGVDIGSVTLPSCINFTSSSGTVARFGAVAPLFFRNCYQRVAVARLGVLVRVVGRIANKIKEFKTKYVMF